ncbi:MAG: hypothetical protein AVDCRST_MAG88-1910, partial [uncultured Thermomicrobiales bacterium]
GRAARGARMRWPGRSDPRMGIRRRVPLHFPVRIHHAARRL